MYDDFDVVLQQLGFTNYTLIDGESTLKRLVRLKGRWFLKAENPEFPELIPRSELLIQGVVRTVIRRLD